jgi:hypothetical protein
MDPVSNIGQLVETLRKRLTESQQKADITAKPSSSAKPASRTARSNVEELQRKIREKLRRIDLHDPKAQQKSVHVFLESVLLSEFGETLIEDPKFHILLDDVQQSMESDPRIRDELSTLIAQLRGD